MYICWRYKRLWNSQKTEIQNILSGYVHICLGLKREDIEMLLKAEKLLERPKSIPSTKFLICTIYCVQYFIFYYYIAMLMHVTPKTAQIFSWPPLTTWYEMYLDHTLYSLTSSWTMQWRQINLLPNGGPCEILLNSRLQQIVLRLLQQAQWSAVSVSGGSWDGATCPIWISLSAAGDINGLCGGQHSQRQTGLKQKIRRNGQCCETCDHPCFA